MSGWKALLVALARAAVDAVGGDHQVGFGESRVVLDLVLEMMLDAELPAPLLEEAEQALALDAAEAVAAGGRGRAAVVDVDVVPVVEAAGDCRVRGRVGGAEVLHRAVGEHDAPAEGVVGPVALVDLHAGPRQRLAEQERRVQARRPAAHADDALHAGITGLNSLDVNYSGAGATFERLKRRIQTFECMHRHRQGWRRALRESFPVAVFGRASRNSTIRGYLYGAMRS